MRAPLAVVLLLVVSCSTLARAQDTTAGQPPSGAYFPSSNSLSTPPEAATPVALTPVTPVPAAASPLPQSVPPKLAQNNNTSATGSQTCGMNADLGGGWSIGLLANFAQPQIFTLSITGPFTFPSDGVERITLGYDHGSQILAGVASSNTISIPLDATTFPQFLHGSRQALRWRSKRGHQRQLGWT